MKNQERYNTREAYENGAENSNLMPSLSYDQLMPATRTDTSPRALKALAAEHEYGLTVERNRAELAYNALNLTAQLSAVEMALSENCPSAEPRLRAIVDSFAFSQAIKIVRY